MSIIETKKMAFTLAEVLITLGVIGVVSAMVLPTVVHKIQMAVLQVQFKKAYSAISNAMEKAKMESEYSIVCKSSNTAQNISDCKEFHRLFESQFKIIKVCKNNGYTEGCIDNIKGMDKVKLDKKSSTYSSSYAMYYDKSLRNKYFFTTSGGFTVGYYERNSRPIYLIDINGPKGPNKWGYDVFSLTNSSSIASKLYCTPGMDNFFEDGGKSCIDMITNKK